MEAGDFHPMNWLNLPVAIIHSPQYVGSDPVHRATWLNLSAYCASQENGGTIEDCRDWKCRRWQQTCGVTKAEVEDTCELWGFEGRSLVIWGYDSDKEIEVAAKRKGGKTGGLKRAENERSRQAELAASSSASSSASTEEKRRESKRREERQPAALAWRVRVRHPADLRRFHANGSRRRYAGDGRADPIHAPWMEGRALRRRATGDDEQRQVHLLNRLRRVERDARLPRRQTARGDAGIPAKEPP